MKRFFRLRLAVGFAIATAFLFLGIIPPLSIHPALAQVAASGTFKATRTCEASRAINGANPGNIRVTNGQSYQAIGFNSQEQRYILIKVPGANPEQRWVSASCGNFSQESSESPAVPAPISSTKLLPFFDTVDNLESHGFPRGRKEDITPPPPQLSAFDKDVLKTCGTIGTKITPSDFKLLMLKHPGLLRDIQEAVGGELLPTRNTPEEFLDDLTAIWSRREGFEHIFCGELEGPRKIGGLHFAGRYLQLQEDGIGGRLANNLDKEEVEPGVVFTLGVVIKKGDRTWIDDLKGYPLVTDAEEMLLDSTKAFKAQGNAQGACLLPVQDRDSGKSYKAVFVKDRDAIVTFYPDATPSGKPCRK